MAQNKQTILVVEDEPKIRAGLEDFLNYQGFSVVCAADGLQGQRLAGRKRFDLIILDLMLPQISGEQLCRAWRRAGMITPIIMLTAKGQQQEKIAGLDLGADDYITKPFSLEELLARIKAVLRRSDPARTVGENFPFGPLTVDMAKLTLLRGKKEIAITPRQGQIIQLFAANPNRAIGREELYETVWGESMCGIETRTVDMHIVHLRELLARAGAEKEMIHTVRGAGYQFIPQ